MKKRIETRLSELEKRGKPARPFIAVFQDLDNRELYSVGDGDELLTWPEIEQAYQGFDIIRVVYVDDWRGPDDELGDRVG